MPGSPELRVRRSLPVVALAACLPVLVLLALAPAAHPWSSRTVPGLTSGGGSAGPLIPVVPGVVLDGGDGLSTSLQPTLKWPGAPGGQKQFEVLDLTGRSLWRINVSEDQVRVNAGVLKQGGSYRWKASAGGASFDGGLFRVDMQRQAVQAGQSFGGVTVGGVSGEAQFAWSSPSLGSVGGAAGFSLSYQPSNTQLAATPVGLPSGWQLTVSAGSDWTRLRYVSDSWVELVSVNGEAVSFARGGGGVWVPQLGEGEGWPVGSQVTLFRAADGTFSATTREGIVALFPAFKNPKGGSTVFARKVWAAGTPSLQVVYGSTGRIKALQDPVSGRSIRFIYRGLNETSELKCVEPKAAHMKIAPSGYLCLTSGWEEPQGRPRPAAYKPQRNRFFYAKDGSRLVLSRIVGDSQAGARLSSVTDLAYDSVGRLKALRSPLATQAVAAGVLPSRPAADDPNVLTTINYDSAGRVSQITRPAPLSCCGRTGPRAWRKMAWSARDGEMVVTVTGLGASQRIGQTTSQVSTMFPTRAVDSSGRVTTTKWDKSIEAPTEIETPGGFKQVNRYDQLGNSIEQRGPSSQVDSSSAPVSRTSFDTRMDGTTEKPLDGLQVFYYKGRDFQGAPLSHQTGPKLDGSQTVASLDFSWNSSPIGSTSKEWSARLIGYLRVPESGDFTFTAAPGTGLWVSGQLCSPECARSGLQADQLLPIQVQAVSGPAGTGSLKATWSGPGASGAIPTGNLRPGYTRPSREKVEDALSESRGLQTLATAMEYGDKGTDQLVAAESTTGRRALRGYEPYNPQAGQFGRPVKSVTAAGSESSTTYYGQHDMESAPKECPEVGGVVQDQAGLPRNRSLPGGLNTSQTYDNAGQVVALRQNGRLTDCQSYNAAGAPVKNYSPADGDSAASTVTTEYNSGGNPLITETTATQEGRGTRKARDRVDILGREVSTTDAWGTVTSTVYDSLDQPVKVTSTTGTGQVTTTEYAYNSAQDLTSIKVDGKTLATYSYNGIGQATSIEYSNGATISFEYDQNGNITSRTLKVGGQEIKESVGLSPGGRVLSHSIGGPGVDAKWAYAYDQDGRLTSADLSGTVPAGASTGTWAYELNAASQRTAITRPGSGPGTGRVTFAYGDAGEMEGTSDPRFGVQGEDQFRYDQLDRATHAGPLRFQYDSSGVVRQVSDGKTTIDYEISGGATVGQKITTTDPQTGQQTSKAVRYSAQGLMLCTRCEKGTAIKRVVNLEGGVVVEIPVARAAGSSKSPAPKTKGRKASTAGDPAEEATAAQAEAADTWRYSDMLGSTAWQATGGEAPAQTALFDPDGNQITTEPPLLFDPLQPNLRYEGSEVTPTEIPTISMGSRTYIPALGVLLQPDPVPNAGPTPYNYANGDPVNFTDPAGTFSWSWSTFTKVTAAVVVGAVVGAFTGGVGAAAGGWVYAAAQAGIGLAAGAAGSAIGQGLAIGFDIPDSEGNVQSQFDWADFAINAGIGAVTAGVSARFFAPRPGAARGGTGKASSPTRDLAPRKSAMVKKNSPKAQTRALLMDWDDEFVSVLGARKTGIRWFNEGGDPVSQVNTFAKRTAKQNRELFVTRQEFNNARNEVAQEAWDAMQFAIH